MELKGRLKLIADLIPKGSILCDVGTDHAYIPIYAVEEGICSRAVAADIREGPVRIAARNVAKHLLQDKIDVRLGGGMQPLKADELGTVVIAGMGGLLITEILRESFDKAKAADYLILQPMNDIETVRQYLYENGFEIDNERIAIEEHKIYNIICAKWTGLKREADGFDCFIGSRLLDSGDANLSRYLEKRLTKLYTAIFGMEKAKIKPESLEGYKEIRKRLVEIIKMRNGE